MGKEGGGTNKEKETENRRGKSAKKPIEQKEQITSREIWRGGERRAARRIKKKTQETRQKTKPTEENRRRKSKHIC